MKEGAPSNKHPIILSATVPIDSVLMYFNSLGGREMYGYHTEEEVLVKGNEIATFTRDNIEIL